MKRLTFSRTVLQILVAAATVASAAKAATTYIARVGAETPDMAVQADAFFPNELWILQGDSIQFQFVPRNEIHTVTFLAQPPGGPEQVRPLAPPPAGPPFFVQGVNCTAVAASSYNGSECASTQSGLTAPSNFTVTFSAPGNYKLVCLVHTDMNGTVHVLASNAANGLLHTQEFYDEQGQQEADTLLQFSNPISSPQNLVTAGFGKIVATGGGLQYGSVMRFLNGTITIHKGQSVTWTNLDPTEPHTVTFGTEPANFIPPTPAGLGTTGPDGTLSATLACSPAPANSCDADFGPESNPAQTYNSAVFLNSGFLQAQAPDRTFPATGDTQLPPGTTRITITFNQTGNYYYHCALHDVDGMLGEVIVVP
jgi:plastocyanin